MTFRRRAVWKVLDVLFILTVVSKLGEALLDLTGWAVLDSRPVLIALVVAYFALSWASPIAATPVQYLAGLRVVGADGRPVALWRALLRSALVVGLVTASFTLFRVMSEPWFGVLAGVALALFFLAAVTPRRQAGHDLALGTVVVHGRGRESPDLGTWLAERGEDAGHESRVVFRLRFDDLLLDAATLAIPIGILAVTLPIHHDKDLHARTAYALEATADAQRAIELYALDNGRFPARPERLDVPLRVDYPDGGYYRLEANGTIRIRFTVKPELSAGSLRLTPAVEDGRVVWRCTGEGSIEPRYLPVRCRG